MSESFLKNSSSSFLVGPSCCECVVVTVLLAPLEGPLQLVLILFSGSLKSISDIAANGTLLKEGGNQEHGIDVQDKDFLASTLASRVKRIAAMWEQASPRPAMQSQCPHITVPLFPTPIHAFAGGTDSLCECLTFAVTKNLPL